jgi:uncharacterized membrane protein
MAKDLYAIITGVLFILTAVILFLAGLWIGIIPLIIGVLLIVFRNREKKIDEVKEVREVKK